MSAQGGLLHSQSAVSPCCADAVRMTVASPEIPDHRASASPRRARSPPARAAGRGTLYDRSMHVSRDALQTAQDIA